MNGLERSSQLSTCDIRRLAFTHQLLSPSVNTPTPLGYACVGAERLQEWKIWKHWERGLESAR